MIETSSKRAITTTDRGNTQTPEPDYVRDGGNSDSTQTDLSMKGMDEDIVETENEISTF